MLLTKDGCVENRFGVLLKNSIYCSHTVRCTTEVDKYNELEPQWDIDICQSITIRV